MGYMRHHAIIFTSWDQELVAQGIEKARELKMTVMGPSPVAINGQVSALICPDGSKEGWNDSDLGDDRRKAFMEWARSKSYDDGSTCLSWVEVSFGGDEPDLAEVLHHNGDRDDRLRHKDHG